MRMESGQRGSEGAQCEAADDTAESGALPPCSLKTSMMPARQEKMGEG